MNAPPIPAVGDNFLDWSKKLVIWLRKIVPVAGSGIRSQETDRGTILSSSFQSVPVGAVLETYADIYGDNSDPTRAAELLAELELQGYLPCDGSTLNTEDYPLLAYALGYDLGDPTFVLPDKRGRVAVGADTRGGSVPAHSDATYTVGAEGGYKLHGQTENNHRDHTFTINLEHTHAQPGSATVCLEAATGDPPSCGTGSPTEIAIYTGTPPVAEFDPTPSDEAFTPSDNGTITRSGTENEVVNIRAKHFGDDENGGGGSAGAIDDTDNRQPYIVANYIIKAF